MHIRNLRCFLLFLTLLACSAFSYAQLPGQVLGDPALQKYVNVGGGVDEINTGDLTIHISIPLNSKGPYGPAASASLDWDSRAYMYTYPNSTKQIFTNPYFRFRSSADFAAGIPYFNPGSGSCTGPILPSAAAWPVQDGSATTHPALAEITGCGVAYGAPGNDGWTVAIIVENDLSVGTEIISPSGLNGIYPVVNPPGPCGYVPRYGIGDLHGNSITDTVCMVTNGNGVITTVGGVLTDAAGNEVIAASLSQNNVVLLQYPGPNGTTSTYTLRYYPWTVNMDFGCPGLSVPAAQTVAMLGSIQYPDGSSASFSYESNTLHPGTITGRIGGVSVPSGGTYTYAYTGGTHGVNCSDGTTSGITKLTPDGSWRIVHTAGSGATNLSTTTITAPSGDYVKDTTVSVLGNPQTPLVIPQMSTVASLSYDSGNNLLSSKYVCYNGNHPPSPLSCANPPTAPGFAVSEMDEWTYVPGVTSPSLKVTLLDSYLRVTDVKTYDFGGTIGGANYDADVQTAYGSWNGTSCVPINVSYSRVNVPLTDKVCSKKTVVSGGTVASYFTYGATGNSFGELVTRQDTVGGVLVTTDSRTYDSLGRVLTSTGPNGETTTSAYTQCSGQELSSVTVKTNSSGGALTTSYSGYDCAGEKATITTDSNGNNSSVNFGSDPFWRPISTTDAAGVVTNYQYFTAHNFNGPAVDVQTTIVSGASAETMTRFDRSGRTQLTEVRQGPSSSQYTITETDYDSNGRVRRVTLPYSGVDGTTNSTIDGTTTTYDGLGRAKTVTGPAYNGSTPGSTLTYTYSANDVLVTQSPAPSGEHAKSRQTQRNGLGEITSVCEVTSMTGSSSCLQSTATAGFLTTYVYYPGGKLKSITQNATGSPQQVRSFTYDNFNTGRLLTASTPESGTVATIYDSDGVCGSFSGFPVLTVDNSGARLCYSYDLADRLTSVKEQLINSWLKKTFLYDSDSGVSCGSGANQAGRIAVMSTTTMRSLHPPSTFETLSQVSYCYDPDGRATDTFATRGSGFLLETPYHVNETWFPNGTPQTLSVPGEPVISYSLDPMGRVNSVSDGTKILVSATSYLLDNSPNVVTFGNGDTSTYTEFANLSPNTVTHVIGTGANNTIAYSPTWNSNGTLKQLATTDQIYPANSQVCTFLYDDLIRLVTDNCGTHWNESSAYDPFGNVTKSGSFPWPSGGYGQLTNRYASTAFTYDANGRLTNDSFDALGWDVFGNVGAQSGTSIVHDAQDRTFSTASGSVLTVYLYSPDGALVGTANDSTRAVQQMFVALPNSRAVYVGGVLSYFDHYDWQGSARVSSTWARGVYSDVSYDAFGMPYWTTGASNNQYAGLTSDFSTGTEQASESRRYHPSQGRWESPDDGIPDPYNPQTLNAYHYSLNMPTSVTDPSGQDEMGGQCLTCLVFNPAYSFEIDQEYFDATSRLAAMWQSSDIGGALYSQAIAQQMAQMDRNIVGSPTPGSFAGSGSYAAAIGTPGGPVGAPGFWEGMIPIWGSGRSAINDFQTGHWGWGLVQTGIAISDVFLVKSAVTAVGKVGIEGLARIGGSNAWGATRNWLAKKGWEQFEGQAFHHWLIPQNAWGKVVPDVIKNQPWNLMGMESQVFHNAIEGKGAQAMGMAGRLWFGSPTWSKVLLTNSLLRGATQYQPEW